MSALMLVENTDDAPAQTERLFQPPRLKHFCPRRALLSAMRTEDMHLPPMHRPLPVLCRP
jgi:hypothetical protein